MRKADGWVVFGGICGGIRAPVCGAHARVLDEHLAKRLSLVELMDLVRGSYWKQPCRKEQPEVHWICCVKDDLERFGVLGDDGKG